METVHTPQPVFDSTLDLLERLTAVSSPSGDLAGLETAARCLGDELGRHGLEVEIRAQTAADGHEQPVLYARSGTAKEQHLFLIGHLDTVLPAARPERRDGRLFATGAIDMKGGLAALCGALELLKRRGAAPPDDLLLIVVPDEEVAGLLSQQVVAQYGGAARGFWVLEPGMRRNDNETLVAGRRGIFDWRLVVHGASAHAGNAYWRGRSALTAAAEWCVGARALASPGQRPTINAGRLIAGERDFVDDVGAGVSLIGTTRQLNVVPDRALVEGEARFLTRADGEEVLRSLDQLTQHIAETHQVEARFEPGPVVPPVEPHGPSRQKSQSAVDLAARAGWTIEVEEDRGGISFSNFLPDPSAIPILDGLGPVGDGMHTREEYVELASLDRRIALLADLLEAER
ncbi:MAG: M20/M25/M40 family metallo-hydrolase [Acidobacteriota bacterium]